jgi:hypothetical protein
MTAAGSEAANWQPLSCVGKGSDAKIRSWWKLSFTNGSFMESVNDGSGRAPARHEARMKVPCMLDTSR